MNETHSETVVDIGVQFCLHGLLFYFVYSVLMACAGCN